MSSESREDEIRKQNTARINACLEMLGEHFDSVQIFVTLHERSEGTLNYAKGVGSWFSRYGQVREWLIKEDEAARIEIRKKSEGE